MDQLKKTNGHETDSSGDVKINCSMDPHVKNNTFSIKKYCPKLFLAFILIIVTELELFLNRIQSKTCISIVQGKRSTTDLDIYKYTSFNVRQKTQSNKCVVFDPSVSCVCRFGKLLLLLPLPALRELRANRAAVLPPDHRKHSHGETALWHVQELRNPRLSAGVLSLSPKGHFIICCFHIGRFWNAIHFSSCSLSVSYLDLWLALVLLHSWVVPLCETPSRDLLSASW